MNSSSEPWQPASYPPLEYRDASELFDGEPAEPAPEDNHPPAPAEPAPAPEELFAARLAARIEEERGAITVQARQDAEREIQCARAEVARAIEQFSQQRDQYFQQVETELVNLALAIARRILRRESQIDPHLLAGLVNYELEQLEAATSVRLFVSPEALSYWSAALPTMSHPVELAADKALAPGELRIETALGSTTVSFERELKEIEHGFFDLLSHRPATAGAAPVCVQ